MRVDFPRFPAASGLVIAGCAFLSMAANGGSEIHRCVDGGRVTYTDRGCTSGEVVAVIAMAPAAANSNGLADDTYGRAVPVSLGMSPRMVFEAMGRPLETIATLEGGTLVEYWVYRSIESTTRIAFQEGRVTRIHTR
jgi:uncharacterized protein DUF4124